MLAFVNGLSLCAGLIVSIGPQNTELLRLGLLKDRAVLLATIFIACDAILIALGAIGVANLISSSRWLGLILTWCTVALLLFLAYQSIRRSMAPEPLLIDSQEKKRGSLEILRRGLALSLLNPLAILETVVIIGSTAAPYQGHHKLLFVLGALSASVIWFYGLAYGARKLASHLRNPWHARVLEGLISCVLLAMACWLAFRSL